MTKGKSDANGDGSSVDVHLAAEWGIPHDPVQHAPYVGSWIKTLKEDKNEIFRSAHDAFRAADSLLALERDRSIASEGTRVGTELGSPLLGGFPSVVLARETTNRGGYRGDRELGPAQSAGSAGTAPNRKTLERTRTKELGR